MRTEASGPVPFERLAGMAAVLVALGAFVYSALFIAIVEGAGKGVKELWFFALMVGGLATLPVLVALFYRLREVDPGVALTGLLLGVSGALGGILHGAYEMGGLITPPEGGYRAGPEAVSHGVLRYCVAGLALLVMAWLMHRSGSFPPALAYLGYLGGVLLLFIYVGRLFDFIEPGDYLSLVPPIVYGFVVHPLWYLWLGSIFLRGRPAPALR